MLPNITGQLQKLTLNSNQSLLSALSSLQIIPFRNAFGKPPEHFLSYNEKKYPIQSPDEPRRPAYVCHLKPDIRCSPKKLFYATWLVRGMSVDEAIKQLSFCHKKAAIFVKEAILEAQKLAVEKHNVEFKSNLWVAESWCSKAFVIRGIRRHAKGKVGDVRYTFSHYFVRLEEGKPPEDYYILKPLDGEGKLKAWKDLLRARKIPMSL